MSYTEIQERNGKKYYYRVKSIRKEGRVTKKRVYLGINLDKKEIKLKEKEADIELRKFRLLLSKKTGDVIFNSMSLLGINVPDRM